MNELVIIKNDQIGVETVNARDLHIFLGSKQDFSTWIKARIKKYGFVQDIDYTEFHKHMESKSKARNEYHLSIDMAKELSMVENNDKGRQARRYFINVENRAKNQSIDYEAIGKMIGMAVTAALTPIVEELQNIKTTNLLPEPVKEDSYSLVAYCKINRIEVNRSELALHGRELKKMATQKGIELNKIADERWGFVNSYPVEILMDYFSA